MTHSSPHSPHDQEMPFVQHLLELRDRLLKMLVTVAGFLLVLMPFANSLFSVLAQPLQRFLPEGTQMIAIEITTPFLTPFKFTMVVSIFLAMPVILYHLWAFIAPGLYQQEKKLIFPLLISSTVLFYLGMLFAYYIVFPVIFKFMVGMTPEGVSMMTDIDKYLDFVLKMLFAFGLSFQVPVAILVFVWMDFITPDALAEKRPYIIVIAFVIGMLMTPPDVISQTLLAVPMWLLFELGLLVARIVHKKAEMDNQEAQAGYPVVREQTDQLTDRDVDKK